MNTQELAQLANTGKRAYASLFTKAHTLIWDIDRDVDWGIKVTPTEPLIDERALWCAPAPTWQVLPPEQRALVAREDTKRTIRLLSIGELVAQAVCAKQTVLFEREDWRNHASAQCMDESRHHLAYERFLEKCGGTQYYLSPGLERMFDLAMAVDDVTTLTVREQLVLESVGFGLFKRLASYAINPLLRRIFELVLRDESRHMAFGLHYIKAHVAEMPEGERVAFADEALAYVDLFNQTDEPTLAGDLAGAGVKDPEGVRASIIEEMREVFALRTMEVVSEQREPDWDDPFIRLFINFRYVGLLDTVVVDALSEKYKQLPFFANIVGRKTAPVVDANDPLAN